MYICRLAHVISITIMISTPLENLNPTPLRRIRMSNPDVVAPITGYDPGYGAANPDEADPEMVEEAQNADKARKIAMIKQGVKTLPFALNAAVSYSKQIDQDAAFKQQIRKQNQQKPIWDYNSMYGDNQPIIKAAKGAIVRSTSSDSLPFKIDDGEFLMLPDGKLEHVKGSSNKTDDVSTILPNGTKIFSNTLKPINSKDTFASLAKKHDYTDEMTKLENPYTSPVSRTSAERMLQRKQKALNTLFDEQQALNGNSNGEVEEVTAVNKGGKICYRDGGEYNISEKEYQRLLKQGYKIEIVK